MCPIGIAVPANQSPVQDRFPRNEQNNEIIMISSPPDLVREISISLFVQFAVDQWREWNVADELAGKQATCLLACFFARNAGFGEVRNFWERTVFFPIVFVGFGFGFGFGLATPRQKGLPLLSFSNTLLQQPCAK